MPCLVLPSSPWSNHLTMLQAAVGSQHAPSVEHSILPDKIHVFLPLKWMLTFSDIRKRKGNNSPLKYRHFCLLQVLSPDTEGGGVFLVARYIYGSTSSRSLIQDLHCLGQQQRPFQRNFLFCSRHSC